MASAERAVRLGQVAGIHAMANLVHGALDVAAETQAAMVAAFAEGTILHGRFVEVVHDLREGEAPQHEVGVAGAAFRPNFHSRKADDFFSAEEWTEAAKRYCNAGETLIRVVMTAVANAIGKPDLASTEKHNQFRTLGEGVAKQAGVSLATEPGVGRVHPSLRGAQQPVRPWAGGSLDDGGRRSSCGMGGTAGDARNALRDGWHHHRRRPT